MAELALAYLRRKRFEAQLIAVEVGRLLLGEKKRASHEEADALIRQLGVDV